MTGKKPRKRNEKAQNVPREPAAKTPVHVRRAEMKRRFNQVPTSIIDDNRRQASTPLAPSPGTQNTNEMSSFTISSDSEREEAQRVPRRRLERDIELEETKRLERQQRRPKADIEMIKRVREEAERFGGNGIGNRVSFYVCFLHH